MPRKGCARPDDTVHGPDAKAAPRQATESAHAATTRGGIWIERPVGHIPEWGEANGRDASRAVRAICAARRTAQVAGRVFAAHASSARPRSTAVDRARGAASAAHSRRAGVDADTIDVTLHRSRAIDASFARVERQAPDRVARRRADDGARARAAVQAVHVASPRRAARDCIDTAARAAARNFAFFSGALDAPARARPAALNVAVERLGAIDRAGADSAPVHSTRHGTPAGHEAPAPQAPASVHAMTHTPPTSQTPMPGCSHAAWHAVCAAAPSTIDAGSPTARAVGSSALGPAHPATPKSPDQQVARTRRVRLARARPSVALMAEESSQGRAPRCCRSSTRADTPHY